MNLINMGLIRNKDDFLKHSAPEDDATEPLEYPCYIFRTLLDWQNGSEFNQFIYFNDLKKMISNLES